MQVKTEHGSFQIGDRSKPQFTVAIAPKSVPSYMFIGIAIGILLGFVAGSVMTLLLGNKSLILVQHLWQRLTGAAESGEHVHFELLLQ